MMPEKGMCDLSDEEEGRGGGGTAPSPVFFSSSAPAGFVAIMVRAQAADTLCYPLVGMKSSKQASQRKIPPRFWFFLVASNAAGRIGSVKTARDSFGVLTKAKCMLQRSGSMQRDFRFVVVPSVQPWESTRAAPANPKDLRASNCISFLNPPGVH